jgi:hypothetical protein
MPAHALTSFSSARHERSPDPGARRGLLLASDVARVEGGRVRVPLFLTYRVPEPFRGSLRRVPRAITLHAEGAGVLFAAPLVDPEQEPPDYEPNFTGNPEAWGNPACCVEGWLDFTLELAPADGPDAVVHLHASVFGYVSDVLSIDLPGVEPEAPGVEPEAPAADIDETEAPA